MHCNVAELSQQLLRKVSPASPRRGHEQRQMLVAVEPLSITIARQYVGAPQYVAQRIVHDKLESIAWNVAIGSRELGRRIKLQRVSGPQVMHAVLRPQRCAGIGHRSLCCAL